MSTYDPFRHLYKSLFASKNDLFVMFTVYLDESNTSPNQRMPIVAGYLSSTFKWSRFGEQWEKLLRHHKVPIDPKYGIPIAHRNKIQNLKGIFSNWAESDRDKFLDKAYPIIRRHIRLPIGCAIPRKAFEQIIPKSMQKYLGGIYGWCVYSCLLGVKTWCEQHKYNKPITYVFEAGAQGQGHVNQTLSLLYKNTQYRKNFRLGGFAFEGKNLKPLQAADFIAYDLGRYALDVELGRTRLPINDYLIQLLGPTKPKENQVKYWDASSLKSLVDHLSRLGVPG